MENYTKEQEAELAREYASCRDDKAYNQYTEVVAKMRSFLAIAGEKKSKETNELFREHIPQSVFGISSDEIASDLGMSENELMAKITDGLRIHEHSIRPIRVKIARIILSEVERRIAREQKRVAMIKAKFGCIYYGELRTGLPLEAMYYLSK